MRNLAATVSMLGSICFLACGGEGSSSDAGTHDAGLDGSTGAEGKVYVVLFTHIEDSIPIGMLGSVESRADYLAKRDALIATAELARSHDLQWVLQPDWKILEAARMYEDATTMADTNGKNAFRYLKEDLGVVIDPHSHESGGYNYTDVAYLLDELGVGSTTVIGGHIWDPSLPQFQEWDRFRSEVSGSMYPDATWRGDILIGAGTPNHVNDPLVSGVWRPQDRDNFFIDDVNANIVAIGAWHNDVEVEGVEELVALYENGTVAPSVMLTASWNIQPMSILDEAGRSNVETTVFEPIAALRTAGDIVVTDFTSLVETWQSAFGAQAYLYPPE